MNPKTKLWLKYFFWLTAHNLLFQLAQLCRDMSYTHRKTLFLDDDFVG